MVTVFVSEGSAGSGFPSLLSQLMEMPHATKSRSPYTALFVKKLIILFSTFDLSEKVIFCKITIKSGCLLTEQ
jgi:hypothetical protein